MSSVTLHPRQPPPSSNSLSPSFPHLLSTPTGLALLELQGTINLPTTTDSSSDSTPIGRLDFPEYRPDALDPSSTAWMRCVHLYVGQHQRLTGEVKKLPKPLAVLRRRDGGTAMEDDGAAPEELAVVEIVKYKIVFSQRPEPVGTASAAA